MTPESDEPKRNLRRGYENGGDWTEYRRLVIAQLQELTDQQRDLIVTLSKLESDVASLKAKQAARDKLMWIMVACIIPIVFAMVLERVKK
jgi:hypothetical protein